MRPHDASLCDYLMLEVVESRRPGAYWGRSMFGPVDDPDADDEEFGGDTTPSLRASTLVGYASQPAPSRARTMTGFLVMRPPAKR
jgi:hypothetical protein